jgi:hypothetical protein
MLIYVNVVSIWQLYEVNSVLLHFLLCPSKCPIVACRALLDLKAVTTKDQGAGDIKQLSELVSFLVGAFSSPWELSTAHVYCNVFCTSCPVGCDDMGQQRKLGGTSS